MFPGFECDVEGSNLGAARVEFKPVEVVPEDSVLRFRRGESLLFGSHAPEHPEHSNEEVAGAAAGVHHGYVGCTVGPFVERARRGGAILVPAQILPGASQKRLRVAGRPPCAEGVLQQEADHVVFGKQLRHG